MHFNVFHCAGYTWTTDPCNRRRSPNAGIMLAHRLRRWPNINPAWVYCMVLAGNGIHRGCQTPYNRAGALVQWLKLNHLRKSEIPVSSPALAFKFQNVSSLLTRKIQYSGEPLWPSGSVLDLRQPGREFWILCLQGSVILCISPFSGSSPGPV